MTKNINRKPDFTNWLVKSNWFLKNGLSVVDVGARSNFEDHWKFYKTQIKLIGFEPEERECQRLNDLYSDDNKKFFPVALGEKKETKTFYMTKYPASAGFLEPDLTWMGRFPDGENLRIKTISKMKIVDFDSFSKNAKLNPVDFIKLDVEGFELQVLRGAQASLAHVLGISIEIEFQKNHKGQPIFCDIDNFLRSKGFLLYDATLYRHSRKALPELSAAKEPGPTSLGQVLWTQALYLRDPIGEIIAGGDSKMWTSTKVTRLMSLMEIFNLNDCAVELVGYFGKKGLFSSQESRLFMDLLTPRVNNKKLTYREYLKVVSQVKKRGYTNQVHHIRQLLYKLLSYKIFQMLISYIKKFIGN